MKTKLSAVAVFELLFALFAIGAVSLTLVPEQTAHDTGAPEPAAAASAPEVVEVPLADVIAAQGNAAVKQIRAEARLVPPNLRQIAVKGESE